MNIRCLIEKRGFPKIFKSLSEALKQDFLGFEKMAQREILLPILL